VNKLFFAWIMLIIIPVFAGQGADFAYDDNGMRDPFWPLVSPSGTLISYGDDIAVSDMVLEGIMSNALNDSVAIINGKVVKIQDKMGPYTIEAIDPDKVILKKGQEIFTLDLPKGGNQ